MKPKGHKDIASFYSIQAIQRGAERVGGPKNIDVSAMLLSNWLTDVAQLLLPSFAVNRKLNKHIRATIDEFFNYIFVKLIDDGTGQWIIDTVQKLLGASGGGLQGFLDEHIDYLKTFSDNVVRELQGQLESLDCNEIVGNPDMTKREDVYRYIDELRRVACASAIESTEELATLPETVRERIEQINEQLQPYFSDLVRVADLLDLINFDDVQSLLENVRIEAHAVINRLFPADEREFGIIQNHLRVLFKVQGYFKFVHPDPDKTSTPKIQHHVFEDIVNQTFKNGWTFMHLDRAVKTKGKYRTDIEKLEGKPEDESEESKFSIYQYLNEDLEIVLAQLYEVEKDWAIPFFETEDQKIHHNNPDWHLGLAKLGVAMHALQDFFAHTNFVEHAVGINYPKLTPNQKGVVMRRLKQWEHTPRPREEKPLNKIPDETNLVSGYFDCIDAVISIGRSVIAVFELGEDPDSFEAKLKENLLKLSKDPWGEAKKQIVEIVEILQDPKKATEDITNETAQKHKKMLAEYGITKPLIPPHEVPKRAIELMLKDSVIFRGIRREYTTDIIKSTIDVILFLHFLFEVGGVLYRYIKLAIDLIFLVRLLGRKVAAKTGTEAAKRLSRYLVREYFPEAFEKKLEEMLVDYSKYGGVNYLLNLFGARRTGCHSLLAKDEDAALLYEEAMNLAMFVDAYIISLLTRAPLNPADHRRQTPRVVRIPRWEEVLHYFFAHPLAKYELINETNEIETQSISLVVDNQQRLDSLKELAKPYRYGRTSFIPPEDKKAYKYSRFNWKVIADANFQTYGLSDEQTKYVINKRLEFEKHGYKTQDRINYAFNPGIRITIPYQIIEQTTYEIKALERLWWREVLKLDGDLRALQELFKRWHHDISQKPFDLDFEVGYHEFNLQEPQASSEMQNTLLGYIEKGESIKKWRIAEEKEFRRADNFFECLRRGG